MIGRQAMGQASAQQPSPAQPAPRGVDDGEQANVTPEEQQAYDEFVRNGLEVIYPQGEQAAVAAPVLENLQGGLGPDELGVFEGVEPPINPQAPTDVLAATSVLIVLSLDASAGAADHAIDDDVVMHGGIALLEELAEVMEAAGIHDFSEEELENATYRAFDLFRLSSPRVDQDALKQQFGQIVEADRSGSLDQLLPGIGSRLNGGAPAEDANSGARR